MEPNQILGIVIIVVAHGLSTIFMLWSRKNIKLIDQKKLNTAREIRKELKNV